MDTQLFDATIKSLFAIALAGCTTTGMKTSPDYAAEIDPRLAVSISQLNKRNRSTVEVKFTIENNSDDLLCFSETQGNVEVPLVSLDTTLRTYTENFDGPFPALGTPAIETKVIQLMPKTKVQRLVIADLNSWKWFGDRTTNRVVRLVARQETVRVLVTIFQVPCEEDGSDIFWELEEVSMPVTLVSE